MAVNREYADEDVPLRAGDELALIPPVSGGATAERRAPGDADAAGRAEAQPHVDVVATPLSLDALVERVRDPRAGAVITFPGVTRDVEPLDYEAYVGWRASASRRSSPRRSSVTGCARRRRAPRRRRAAWERVGDRCCERAAPARGVRGCAGIIDASRRGADLEEGGLRGGRDGWRGSRRRRPERAAARAAVGRARSRRRSTRRSPSPSRRRERRSTRSGRGSWIHAARGGRRSGPPGGDRRGGRGHDAGTSSFRAPRPRASVLAANELPSLRRVVNATGVILHTNLGRAPLGRARARGRRSRRRGLLEPRARSRDRRARLAPGACRGPAAELTGAEAALAVNNGAGAVLLAAAALGGPAAR